MRIRHHVPTIFVGGVLLALLCFIDGHSATPAQLTANPPGAADAQRCAALATLDFGSVPDAPTRITSALEDSISRHAPASAVGSMGTHATHHLRGVTHQ